LIRGKAKILNFSNKVQLPSLKKKFSKHKLQERRFWGEMRNSLICKKEERKEISIGRKKKKEGERGDVAAGNIGL
jgi:hypothetical protein